MVRGGFIRDYIFPVIVVAIIIFCLIDFPPDNSQAIKDSLERNRRIQLKLKIERRTLSHLEGKVFPVREVTITVYHMEEGQTDSSPCIGAWGDLVIPGRTCAVSYDLIWGPPYLSPGDIAVVDGEAWLIMDLMNKRFTKRIDLLVAPWVRFKKVGDVTFIKQGGEENESLSGEEWRQN